MDGQSPVHRDTRFVHVVVDSVVCIVLAAIVLSAIYLLVPMARQEADAMSLAAFAVTLIICIVVYLAYYVAMEAGTQRTLGKFITGAEVVAGDGGRPSLRMIVERSIFRLVPFSFISGIFAEFPIWSHDVWSNTIVTAGSGRQQQQERPPGGVRADDSLDHPTMRHTAILVGLSIAADACVAAFLWNWLQAGTFAAAGTDQSLLLIGIALTITVAIYWLLSNWAEATPNEDQLAEMHHFVNDHFAKYVARGVAAEGIGEVPISQDRAWRKVYLQHLNLHNELYALRRDVALRVFEQEIDAAVLSELDALSAAGNKAGVAVAAG